MPALLEHAPSVPKPFNYVLNGTAVAYVLGCVLMANVMVLLVTGH